MHLKKIIQTLPLLVFLSVYFTACSKEQPKTETPAITRKSNQEVADYLRKALNLPANVAINVKDQQSKIPGMQAVLLEFQGSRGTQTQLAWIGPNNELIVGKMFDLSLDPYKENLKKINLAGAPASGSTDAKVTIVEYSDFQCPFCSRAHSTVQELLNTYSGKVKVVYKHLPLNNIHPWAEDAAVASACVQQQNQEAFWKLSDQFFANQKTLSKESLTPYVMKFATESNLNTQQLQKCMTERATLSQVRADMAEAGSLGFTSTPSFLVNGRSVIGAVPIEQFKSIVDEALVATQ